MKRYIKLEEPVERPSLLERLNSMDEEVLDRLLGYASLWLLILAISTILIVLIANFAH